jgi:formylglycine-generating enzyme required for sulfatase activity
MKSKHTTFISMLLLSGCLFSAVAVSAEDMVRVDDMVLVPEGSFTPFFLKKDDITNSSSVATTPVNAFWLDATPVTNRKFQAFVNKHPDWHKSNIKKIFTDSHYLEHWQNTQGSADSADLDKPVVNVSWFAAAAYCEAQDKRLPSTDEWEYTLTDNDRDTENLQKQIMAWYSVPNKELPAVRSKPANGFGIFDMVGLIWEWTADFNSYMAPPDSRNSGDKNLFCGSGSLNASNLSDYAAFMRYSYRESLKGNFTGKNLGFRCAKDAK